MFSATARMTSRAGARWWLTGFLLGRARRGAPLPEYAGAPPEPASGCTFLGEGEHQLADVLAAEELQQAVGKGLNALDDLLEGLGLAGGDPASDGARRLRVTAGVVEHHHPRHARALDQQRQVVGGPLDRRRAVVLRDGAADDDPGAARQSGERGVQDVAADVVEIDVDPLRATLPQGGLHVLGLVIDRGVEAQLLHEVAALLGAAGDADGAASLELGDLADHHADSAGGARNDDGLAGCRPADVEQAELGGHAGGAESRDGDAHPAARRAPPAP